GGTIGPNLTDSYWIHGGAPDKIYATIHDGVLAKGMPAWGAQLGNSQVQSLTAFVLTLRDTNVAGGKPPQGEPEGAVIPPKVN
ncbi:MAG: c-type cytochrome, partial [Polyangiaceae bacterium]